MDGNLNPSQRLALLGAIAPQSAPVGALSSGWIDMRDTFTVLALVALGVLGGGASVDAKIEQAKDGTGTAVKEVTGAAIAQITKAGGGDNKQALINLRQEDLDRNGGFRFVRLTVTVAGAASQMSAALIGLDPRYGAANASNVTSVGQVVG
jgi:hypothetical protein